jgi:hypothetical protein
MEQVWHDEWKGRHYVLPVSMPRCHVPLHYGVWGSRHYAAKSHMLLPISQLSADDKRFLHPQLWPATRHTHHSHHLSPLLQRLTWRLWQVPAVSRQHVRHLHCAFAAPGHVPLFVLKWLAVGLQLEARRWPVPG